MFSTESREVGLEANINNRSKSLSYRTNKKRREMRGDYTLFQQVININ
jgi:hypothetical protein